MSEPCDPNAAGWSEMYLRLSSQPERVLIVLEKLRTMWLAQPNFTAAELAGIEAPTLIIDGQNETEVRIDHVESIAKAIPNVELIILPGMGHGAPLTNPIEWNKAVLEFLKGK